MARASGAPVRSRPTVSAPSEQTRGDLLDAVRTATAEVARRSTRVHLVAERVGPYADELLATGLLAPEQVALDLRRRSEPHRGEDAELVAGRVVALDAVNFGSGWHDVVRKRLAPSGARTMAAGLTRWIGAGDDAQPLAERLANLDTELAHRIFDQPHDDGPLDELMGLFTVALDDLGRFVLDRYDGSFVALVEAAGRSAATLTGLLADMPLYCDVSRYEELDVPLHKRGQITAADLSRAFGAFGPGRFDDLDRLTAFADNLVPHVLRMDGVLAYDVELLDRIGRRELLVAGSPEEVEIRALGVHAVEEVRAALRERGTDVASWYLDQVLWERGAAPAYKAVPRHRARSAFY